MRGRIDLSSSTERAHVPCFSGLLRDGPAISMADIPRVARCAARDCSFAFDIGAGGQFDLRRADPRAGTFTGAAHPSGLWSSGSFP